MPTLMGAMRRLNHFSSHEGVVQLLDDLTDLNKEVTDDKIELLRKKLLCFLSSETTFNGRIVEQERFSERFDIFNFYSNKHFSVYDAVYNALLALAELKPLNDNDPITLSGITPKNKLLTSTGYQFDMITLIQFHNQKAPLGVSKPIVNIMTNKPFSPSDTAHIQNLIKQKVNSFGRIKSMDDIHIDRIAMLSTLVGTLLYTYWKWSQEKPDYEHHVPACILGIFYVCVKMRNLNKICEQEPLLNYKPHCIKAAL